MFLSEKYKPTYSIGSKTNISTGKKRKRSPFAAENRKSRASVIFLSLEGGGAPVDGEYDPEKYGVLQIDNVDLDVLGLFTSRTDKACLGDLISSKCFIGEAEELVEDFL